MRSSLCFLITCHISLLSPVYTSSEWLFRGKVNAAHGMLLWYSLCLTPLSAHRGYWSVHKKAKWCSTTVSKRAIASNSIQTWQKRVHHLVALSLRWYHARTGSCGSCHPYAPAETCLAGYASQKAPWWLLHLPCDPGTSVQNADASSSYSKTKHLCGKFLLIKC